MNEILVKKIEKKVHYKLLKFYLKTITKEVKFKVREDIKQKLRYTLNSRKEIFLDDDDINYYANYIYLSLDI